MTRNFSIALALAALFCPTMQLKADLVNLQAIGQVQFVGSEVSGTFTPGDLFAISLTYDLAELPINSSNLTNRASYIGTVLTVEFDGNTWSDVPEVTVFNDDVPDISDRIEANGFSPTGPDLPGGLSIDQITLRLGFGGATDVYNATYLPTATALQQLVERDDFESLGSLDFGGFDESVFFSFINVNVQSVPEPIGLPLFALGFMLPRRRAR